MENGKEGAFACANQNGLQKGLTKREYFVGLAMQGIVSNTEYIMNSSETIAQYALKIADELLKQLDQ